ncbi:MAG TPA: hypothetical protein VLC55_11190 [Burkholderiales bacterium]|nr:hypothetical protein [Burkholderiales bacterium]
MDSLTPLNEEQFAAARELARAHAPHFPLAFLRGTREPAFREWMCEGAFPAGDGGLAFEHGPPRNRWLLVANRLKWDSDWLGRSIARLDLAMPVSAPFERPHDPPRAAVAALCDELRRRGVDYLFAVVPARHIALVKALGAAGFSLLETRLAYWHGRLGEFVPPRRSPVRLAGAADVEALGELSANTVNAFDRFHAEDWFDRAAVNRVMREWVNASVTKAFADAVLVPDLPGKSPRALMTINYHRRRWPALGVKASQMVLAAVAPDATGWFHRLVVESMLHVREQGADALYLTTQATNKATLHVFESLGYHYGECTLVFRRVLAER